MFDLNIINFAVIGFLVHSIMFLGPIDRSVLIKLILTAYAGVVFGFQACFRECASTQQYLIAPTVFYFLKQQ